MMSSGPARVASHFEGNPQWIKIMAEVTVFGFPHSSFVHIARLVLTHKEVPYTFHDLEPDMGSPKHLALHPFDRVPILQHGDFVLYETSAIVAYLEEQFPTPSLQPDTPQGRARMNQWISAVNSYYYPYMIYHVGHERNVFPRLGIPSDKKVVAHALPKIEVGLQVAEKQLSHGQGFLLSEEVTLADYYLLPSTYSFGRNRRPDDVPEVPGCAGLARTDGSLAGRATAPQGNCGSAADRACQEVARLAPAEILTLFEKTSGCRECRRRSASQSRCCHTASATSRFALALPKSLMCPRPFGHTVKK